MNLRLRRDAKTKRVTKLLLEAEYFGDELLLSKLAKAFPGEEEFVVSVVIDGDKEPVIMRYENPEKEEEGE